MRRGMFNVFLPVLGAGALWQWQGEPAHAIGFAVLVAVFASLWPLAALCLVFGVPALAYAAVPRRWRVSYRRRHGRAGARSAYIPAWLRRVCLAADRRRCVHCGELAGLQVDHYFPWCHGGATSVWNTVTLCGRCNRVKSDYWPWPSGHVSYRPCTGAGDRALAAAILASERRARRNPLRWWRAAWAVAL